MTATTAPDGTVLLAGGIFQIGCDLFPFIGLPFLNPTEIVGMVDSTATLLSNGKVLKARGLNIINLSEIRRTHICTPSRES